MCVSPTRLTAPAVLEALDQPYGLHNFSSRVLALSFRRLPCPNERGSPNLIQEGLSLSHFRCQGMHCLYQAFMIVLSENRPAGVLRSDLNR